MLKIADVKPGDRLIADDGFDCIGEGGEVIVCADPERTGEAALFVHCSEGQHFLDGQVDDDRGIIVGFERAPG